MTKFNERKSLWTKKISISSDLRDCYGNIKSKSNLLNTKSWRLNIVNTLCNSKKKKKEFYTIKNSKADLI